jgi:signal transduction histidine kinase/PAS domain-containing protein
MNIVVVASRSREVFTSLREILGEGYDLHFAKRLSDVFAALAKRPTDAVFVDTRLEDCEGTAAIREIVTLFPETVLIYLSPEQEGKRAGISAEEGAYACMRKPLDREAVRLLVEKATEKRKLTRKIDYLLSVAEGADERDWHRHGDSVPPGYGPGSSAFVGKGMIRKLLRSLGPITDLNKLLGRFADSVRELFGSNNVAVFIWDSAKARYATGAWQGVDEGLAVVCSFSRKHGIVRWLMEQQQLLVRDKLRDTLPHDVAAEMGTDMDALRAELIMPLLDRGDLIGFLSLGRKMTGKKYEEEELELLAVIGDCASGAISTAVVHREISTQKVRAEAVLSSIACGIVAVDAEGRILSLNSFARNALNLSANELIGKNVQKLGSVLADMVLRTLKEDQVFVNRPYRDGATGQVFSVSTCRLFDDRSTCLGAILFFTALQEETGPGARDVGASEAETFAEFCGHVADKIKNPLSSIKTFSQLLPEKFDDIEFREKFSEIVGKAVDRINSVADGLTAYGATGPLDLSSTNITAVIENALASLRNSLDKRNLRVIAPGTDRPARVLGNGQLIRSAFLNVLKNSIESTPPDGTITVAVKEVSAGEARRGKHAESVFDTSGIDGGDGAVLDDEMFVQAEFRDNGKGIPREAMTKIGEPFFTTKEQKIGLGLAIVRRIVSRHRGRMEIESEEGKGTTVRIILPRDQNSQ